MAQKIEIKDYPGQRLISFGTVKIIEMYMDTMADNRARTIRVWLPESYDGVRRFPVLYMHDAQNLYGGLDDRWKWYVEQEMKKIPDEDQVVVVGIDTNIKTRFEELCPPWPLGAFILKTPFAKGATPHGDQYRDFVIDTLKPVIDENFMTKPGREYTGVGGASMGGIESLYMFISRPDVFSKALCFSVATGVSEMGWIHEQLDKTYEQYRDGRIYLFNGGQTIDGGNIRPTLEIYEHLSQKGMDYQHVCYVLDTREPHYEPGWQKYFADAVKYLYTADNSVPFPPAPPNK